MGGCRIPHEDGHVVDVTEVGAVDTEPEERELTGDDWEVQLQWWSKGYDAGYQGKRLSISPITRSTRRAYTTGLIQGARDRRQSDDGGRTGPG